MSAHPFDSVAVRSGDAVYRIALLISGSPDWAHQATLNAFVRTFAESATCDEDALFAALLAQHPRRLRPWLRSRLPRPLRRLHGPDRALLGLWLLQGVSGARLLKIVNKSLEALVTGLADALLRLAPCVGVMEQPQTREQFHMWLTYRLGLGDGNGGAAAGLGVDQQGWELLVERAADMLRCVVGRERLPMTCLTAIEESFLAMREQHSTRWWLRRSGLALLAGCAALVVMVLVASSGAQRASFVPQRVTPQGIVQRALDGWLEHPAAGSRQREVWAIHPDEALGPEPLITKLWLDASSMRHRFEVRRGDKVVEWQIGDGDKRVTYAADPFWTGCPWGVDQPGGVLNNDLRTFGTTPAQQQSLLHARLTSGAYGFGYVVLRRALVAPDLRSLGTHVEGSKSLLVLRFTDRNGSEERHFLLTLDTTTQQLWAVREVQSVGGQQTARDLWRLISDEPLARPISLAPLPWPGVRSTAAQLLDPTCPALLPEYLVSLRDVVANAWWSSSVWLPTTLPVGVTAGALVNPNDALRGSPFVQNTRVVLVGHDRWLSIVTISRPGNSTSSGTVRGRWRWLREEQQDVYSASICLNPERSTRCYTPQIDIVARGWPRAELLALIDTLAPATVQTWGKVAPLFVEPKPLPPQVNAALIRAVQAQAVPVNGVFGSAVERENQVDPLRPRWSDPYHLPLDVLAPARATHEQWLEYVAGRPARYKQVQTASTGELLGAETSDDVVHQTYKATTGKLFVENVPRRVYIGTAPQPLADQLLTSFFTTTEPISLTEQPTAWMLEQRVSDWKDPLAAASSTPTGSRPDDVGPGSWLQRLYLDKASYELRSFDVSFKDASGNETQVSSTRLLPAVGTASAYSKPPRYELPQLPPDTLTITNNFAAEPLKITAEHLDLRIPVRTLRFPNTPEAIVEADRNPWKQSPAALGKPVDSAVLLPNLYQPLYAFDNTLLHITRYHLPALGSSITIRQGPRDVLHHVLRYQSRDLLGPTLAWDASRPVAVTIADEQRTGWLITHQFQTALVVEVEDVLLYITSEPEIDLTGPLLTELARLQWADFDP